MMHNISETRLLYGIQNLNRERKATLYFEVNKIQ